MLLQMPIMDGFEATAAVRALASSQLAKVPIVALTAAALPEDVARCIAAGMDAHVPKPIEVRGACACSWE